jgi:hypothetical protein
VFRETYPSSYLVHFFKSSSTKHTNLSTEKMKRSAPSSSHESSSSCSSVQWNHRTEILASSMMLVSISENASLDLQHKSRNLSSSTLGSGSGESLSGWGPSAARKSYKVDLNLMGEQEQQQAQQQEFKDMKGDDGTSSMDSGDEDDAWGFFIDSR